jgi:hypothetical protein
VSFTEINLFAVCVRGGRFVAAIDGAGRGVSPQSQRQLDVARWSGSACRRLEHRGRRGWAHPNQVALDIVIIITIKLPYLDATMRPTPECNGPGGNGRWWRSPRLLVAPARTGPFGSLTVQGPPTAT